MVSPSRHMASHETRISRQRWYRLRINGCLAWSSNPWTWSAAANSRFRSFFEEHREMRLTFSKGRVSRSWLRLNSEKGTWYFPKLGLLGTRCCLNFILIDLPNHGHEALCQTMTQVSVQIETFWTWRLYLSWSAKSWTWSAMPAHDPGGLNSKRGAWYLPKLE